MSEHEERIRDTAVRVWGADAPSTKTVLSALGALLAEHRAEVAAARDAALEEVCTGLAKQADGAVREGEDDVADVLNSTHDWVHGLKSEPARRFIPEDAVRDVLSDLWHGTGGDGSEQYDSACRDFATEAAHRLGVTLDVRLGTPPARRYVDVERVNAAAPHGCPGCIKCSANEQQACPDDRTPAPESERCVCGRLLSEHDPYNERVYEDIPGSAGARLVKCPGFRAVRAKYE
jgi:hypothetical protein